MIRRRHVDARARAGILLLGLLPCCSSQAPSLEADGGDFGRDGGDFGRDGGDFGEIGADGGAPPGDAGSLPSPYDFAVRCGADPCVTRISARGGAHVCAVLRDGSVHCWGSNTSGQLGAGSSDGGSIPAYVARPTSVPGANEATDVTATGEGTTGTTCVTSVDGAVVCFGSDAWGQLGRGTRSEEPFPEPAPVEGLRAKSVTLTNHFALALGTDGWLWSWGANDARQLGRASSAPDATSATVAAHAEDLPLGVRSCAGTSQTAFVVLENGNLLSWGGGTSEQLGRATSLVRDPIPTAISLDGVSSVTAGAAHACALSGGRIHCWGKNEDGQLGTGSKAEELVPALVLLPPGVHAVAVTAGGDDTCAIAADGTVYCWGANGSGQLADPVNVGSPVPRRIDGLGGEAVAVAIMETAICALLRSGNVSCWGDNLFGQLGRGERDLELHVKPTPVEFP